MTWVKIDDHFYDHPKWADAPGDSIALWLAAMAWCNRNDSIEGFIPTLKLNGLIHVRNVKTTIKDLLHRGAFKSAKGGYLIHDYAEYQQPEKVREIREKKAAAGRKGAAVRWGERANAAEYGMAPPIADAMADAIDAAIANDSESMADGMAEPLANEWPVPRSPSSSSVVEQHPPYACLSPAIEEVMNDWSNGMKMP